MKYLILYKLVFANSGGLISQEPYMNMVWEDPEKCHNYAQFKPNKYYEDHWVTYQCLEPKKKRGIMT